MSRYKFQGYTITNCGYHQPDHCVWWEAVNDNGEACFHGNTLREVEFMILDYEWEQKMRKKDEQIERLKREKIDVEADALAVGGIVEAARRREETAEKSSAVGNAAAMREALGDVYNTLEKIQSFIPHLSDVSLMRKVSSMVCHAKNIIDTALSAPPRNCDLPLVVNGPANNNADKAWLVFKHSNSDAYFDVSGLLRCIDWLFATAAERKGEGDGK